MSGPGGYLELSHFNLLLRRERLRFKLRDLVSSLALTSANLRKCHPCDLSQHSAKSTGGGETGL